MTISSKGLVPHTILHGEFIDLVPLAAEHAAATLAWRTSERAVFLNRGANTLDEQGAWIAARPHDEYNYVISIKGREIAEQTPTQETKQCPVGMIALTGIDLEQRSGEPGRFLIGEPEAVRGVPAAAEAMKLIYHLAFEQLGLLRLHGIVAADNGGMIKWQKFLGMKDEGRLSRHLFVNGKFQDAVQLAIVERDYRTVALPRINALIAGARPARS